MNTSPSANDSQLQTPRRMEWIAHRGASHVAPENTVAAYKLAWEMGAGAAETDVYLTADQQVVCSHDFSTKRTTGVDLDIKKSTFSDLRKLDAGRWKDAKFTGEPIPLLSEVLATIPPGKRLYVEVKHSPGVLPFLKDVLEKSGKISQTAIIGFEFETMAEAKKLMPERPVYWLCGTRQDKSTKAYIPHDLEWINQAKAVHLDGLDVNSNGMTREFADAVRQAKLQLVVWTVDDLPTAIKMRDFGADGLTTNRVDMMKDAAFASHSQ